MIRLKLHKKGQAVLDYAIVIGIVALALSMMSTYLRRGIQAGIKIAADEIGRQEDSVESAKEVDPTKGTLHQTFTMRTKTSPPEGATFTHQVTYDEDGVRTTEVQEKTELVESSPSKTYTNWKKD